MPTGKLGLLQHCVLLAAFRDVSSSLQTKPPLKAGTSNPQHPRSTFNEVLDTS
jgi:hypothetical protein